MSAAAPEQTTDLTESAVLVSLDFTPACQAHQCAGDRGTATHVFRWTLCGCCPPVPICDPCTAATRARRADPSLGSFRCLTCSATYTGRYVDVTALEPL